MVVVSLIYFNLFVRAMKRIVILDYGLGNLRSVQKGLEHVGASPMISGDTEEVLAADGVILPGVGAFMDAMRYLAPIGGDYKRLRTVRKTDAWDLPWPASSDEFF